MTELDSKTFDVAAWLEDAHLPERSATVYQRADLAARLMDLERQIRNEAAVEEAPAGGSPLVKEYKRLVEQFEASKLTVFVRAVTQERQQEIVAELGDGPGKDAGERERLEYMREIGAATLAEAIVGVAEGNGGRQPAEFTPRQVRSLNARLGDAQAGLINDAFLKACREIPVVSADFLLKLSSRDGGDE